MSSAASPGSRDVHPFSAQSLAAAMAGRLLHVGSRSIQGGAVDSRKVTPGTAFFALPGERTDGHRYLEDAVVAGAGALIVTDPAAVNDAVVARLADASVIVVDDALAALQAAARAWRTRFDPVVVGVTGSIAKTSTKEAIAEVLAERWTVLRTAGNENNEVGLPLTLLQLTDAHEAAVLEMGMYVPGEIRTLATIARPRIGVVTAVRGSHLSRAGSIEAIERGKRELVEALPADGTAILNADDPRVIRMAEWTPARAISYGFSERADVRAGSIEHLGEGGMRFRILTSIGDRAVTTPVLGAHNVHNALAAAAVGVSLGLPLEGIVRGIEKGSRAPHRSTLLTVGPWRVLDDTYNAAPDSMAAALDLLANLPGRRVAVLGEMRELGDAAEAAHRAVGEHAARTTDLLIVVGGGGAVQIARGATAVAGHPEIIETADRDEALEALTDRLQPGDVVLLKASRGVELDKLVDALIAVAREQPARSDG